MMAVLVDLDKERAEGVLMLLNLLVNDGVPVEHFIFLTEEANKLFEGTFFFDGKKFVYE